jgi:methylated-DNA-protein-cysteine methyltransferase-like protein
MATEISLRIEALIRAIPPGRVSSYSAIATAAGIPNGARQVARLLHSRAESQDLPWQRVVKKDGSIALPRGGGFELQRAILLEEGVEVSLGGLIDLKTYGWQWSTKAANSGRTRVSRKA